MVAERDGYDIVILGGGSGGYACALRAAELGKRVALVEKGKVGGTCLHRGCIPTKALLHAAEVADLARESASVGVRATFDGIDMAGVNAYKDKVVTKLWRGLVGLIGSRHIDIIDGEGRLVSPTQVQVGDTLIEGAHVVLASGSEARSLPGLEIDGRRVITSDQALELDRVPASAVILGGGVIGVEFASVWRSFGADVTIVEMLPHLLPLEDESTSKLLERAFRRRGIGHKLGARFESVKGTDAGVTVTLEGGATLDAELLLVADVGWPRLRGRRGGDAARLRHGRRVLPDECSDDLGGRGPHPRPAAGPRRVRRGDPGRRAAQRAPGGADRL
jgi:dihydrolipoamide dehydrogenase